MAKLTDSFVAEPFKVRNVLERWIVHNHKEFITLGLRHLAQHATSPGDRYLARILTRSKEYYKLLMDPDFLNPAEAANASKTLSRVDPHFFIELIHSSDQASTQDAILRILHLVEELNRASLVMPWLRRMTNDTDPKIQAKAVSIMTRLCSNALFIERQLASPEPRVRANAVEGLWNVDSSWSRFLLEKASEDPNNRVAANALLGLYLLKVEGARERILAGAEDESPEFRVSIAWVMGQSGDGAFFMPLQEMTRDPEESVRRAAWASLIKLGPEAEVKPEAPKKAQVWTTVSDTPSQPTDDDLDLRIPRFWTS